ncbi:MAG: hypothetical protein Q7S23_01490 [bacterium]|nr:hypothetical protein [bacterium]
MQKKQGKITFLLGLLKQFFSSQCCGHGVRYPWRSPCPICGKKIPRELQGKQVVAR